mmetsp:Transcript_28874/g.65264  ORF Transcript_28874/g.65264 Transcript_28874/m.65264 type:complete len:758 (+) Transcript_28874:64-2337(+)
MSEGTLPESSLLGYADELAGTPDRDSSGSPIHRGVSASTISMSWPISMSWRAASLALAIGTILGLVLAACGHGTAGAWTPIVWNSTGLQGLAGPAPGIGSSGFRKIDRNGDQGISKKEFNFLFDRLDRNLDGSVSAAEFHDGQQQGILGGAMSARGAPATVPVSLPVPPPPPPPHAAPASLPSLAPVMSGPAGGCKATSEAACLRIVGCRWFSMSTPCSSCGRWLGKHMDKALVTGCHGWDPVHYCHESIFEPLRQKCWQSGGCEPSDPGIVDVVRHFHFAVGRRDVGNPHPIRRTCDVWCDPSTKSCVGQPRAKDWLRGVNYGGRFVPEEFLELPGKDALYAGVAATNQNFEGTRARSICDIEASDIGSRMAQYLDMNIKFEHFRRMKEQGFNVVRLPVAYWNLIDLPAGETPDGPPSAKARWANLQRMMPAQEYMKWINKVFDFAGRTGLRIMPDLHSAPGGQSGNECTGCDQGPTDAIFHLFPADGQASRNVQLAVQAIGKMAQICAAMKSVCYGIELLNEPYGAHLDTEHMDDLRKDIETCMKVGMQKCRGLALLYGEERIQDPEGLIRQLQDSKQFHRAPPPHTNTSREALWNFYAQGIRAARAHMGHDQPIVVMDWPPWLGWWMENAKFTYREHGNVVFSTHFYKFPHPWTMALQSAKDDFRRDLQRLKHFFLYSGYDIMVSEWALNSHGNGDGGDSFDYNTFADWNVHNFNQMSLGSMIWNYDSRWSAWGSIATNKVGQSFVDWGKINAR